MIFLMHLFRRMDSRSLQKSLVYLLDTLNPPIPERSADMQTRSLSKDQVTDNL